MSKKRKAERQKRRDAKRFQSPVLPVAPWETGPTIKRLISINGGPGQIVELKKGETYTFTIGEQTSLEIERPE